MYAPGLDIVSAIEDVAPWRMLPPLDGTNHPGSIDSGTHLCTYADCGAGSDSEHDDWRRAIARTVGVNPDGPLGSRIIHRALSRF